MSVIGIIPARGGSKAMPRKNLAPLAGKPLIAYTCECALAAKSLDRAIVSTDDGKIAEVADRYGVEAPFTRPGDLAEDDTPMLDVLCHACDWLEESGTAVTVLVLLQPTSPLRRPGHVDDVVELLENSGADAAVSVVEVPHQFNPVSVMRMSDGVLEPFLPDRTDPLRRQDKPRVFARNGPAVLAIRPEQLRRGELYGGRTVGYEMPLNQSLDIDDPGDLRLVEYLLNR